MIKLFKELINGTVFHFGDNEVRKLIKDDASHYVAPEGRHKIHPHVAVIQNKPRYVIRNIFKLTEEESDESKKNG